MNFAVASSAPEDGMVDSCRVDQLADRSGCALDVQHELGQFLGREFFEMFGVSMQREKASSSEPTVAGVDEGARIEVSDDVAELHFTFRAIKGGGLIHSSSPGPTSAIRGLLDGDAESTSRTCGAQRDR
jgi:hypothetical protein